MSELFLDSEKNTNETPLCQTGVQRVAIRENCKEVCFSVIRWRIFPLNFLSCANRTHSVISRMVRHVARNRTNYSAYSKKAAFAVGMHPAHWYSSDKHEYSWGPRKTKLDCVFSWRMRATQDCQTWRKKRMKFFQDNFFPTKGSNLYAMVLFQYSGFLL